VTHAFLTYNIIGAQERFMAITSLINETSGKSTFVIDSTHSISKEFLSSGNNNAGYINKEAFSSLTDKFK
jgi:hypothetical protein